MPEIGTVPVGINELIATELSAIRQAVENRGPVDVDALARRVVELGNQDRDAALARSAAARAGGLAGESDEPQRRGAELVRAPGGPPIKAFGHDGLRHWGSGGASRVQGGKFDGMEVDEVVFVRNFLQRAAAMNPASVRPPSAELEGIAQRALSGTGTATGAEYVPTGLASQLWLDSFLASKIVASLQRVPMPTNPFDMPLGWGALTWRKGTRNSQSTPQDPPTAKSTLTADEQVVEVDWDYTLDEDAVIAVLPSLRTELARSAGEQMDAFVLNADSDTGAAANVNSIDGAPAGDAYYIASGQNGVRRQFLVDNSAQTYNMASAALTDAGVLGMLALMGKYAADPARVLMVADAKTYINGLLAIANVRTRDKFGPEATVVTGQLASYAGIPVIVSESAPLTQSSGKVSITAANNTLGQLSVLNRDMWRVGFRRELLIEIDRDVKKRQFVMVVSFRIAVANRGTRSSATHTAGMKAILV